MWNAIYDFFVTNIFGGYTSMNVYVNAVLGRGSTNTIYNNANSYVSLFGHELAVGNYFAYLATLVSIILILILCCLFIYRLIRLVGRLFSGGSL